MSWTTCAVKWNKPITCARVWSSVSVKKKTTEFEMPSFGTNVKRRDVILQNNNNLFNKQVSNLCNINSRVSTRNVFSNSAAKKKNSINLNFIWSLGFGCKNIFSSIKDRWVKRVLYLQDLMKTIKHACRKRVRYFVPGYILSFWNLEDNPHWLAKQTRNKQYCHKAVSSMSITSFYQSQDQ